MAGSNRRNLKKIGKLFKQFTSGEVGAFEDISTTETPMFISHPVDVATPGGLTLPVWLTNAWEEDDLAASLSVNDPVATWTDSIGGVNFTQATASQRPIWRDGFVEFDGVDDRLLSTLSNAQPNTIIIAGNFTFTGTQVYFDGDTAREHLYSVSGVLNGFAGTVVSFVPLGVSAGKHMMGCVFNGAAGIGRYDDQTSTRNFGANALGDLRIGAGSSAPDMDLYGVYVATGYAATSADLDELQAYCAAKWGTP